MTNEPKSPISLTGRSDREEPDLSRRGFFRQAVGGAAGCRGRCVLRNDDVGSGAGPVWRRPLCLEIDRVLPRCPQRSGILRPMRPFPPTCGMPNRGAADQSRRVVPPAATSIRNPPSFTGEDRRSAQAISLNRTEPARLPWVRESGSSHTKNRPADGGPPAPSAKFCGERGERVAARLRCGARTRSASSNA
jgi:hypothetical protein